MCYSFIGWGWPSSIMTGGCDKVLRVWDGFSITGFVGSIKVLPHFHGMLTFQHLWVPTFPIQLVLHLPHLLLTSDLAGCKDRIQTRVGNDSGVSDFRKNTKSLIPRAHLIFFSPHGSVFVFLVKLGG
ncbi:uncharacterized protein LACBIDRAFT_328313 [Laccaria bicolor S238N-H82]|uniref:Predicted protein n=1 Tax=Laccaria bicolor (strain S238N-H82 / ATCC MYA-4686) TaxID=486041 RepID=B0DEI0_LACBS|nr:uncharacterized protein LACBIDRAFT_328313 [Laccaria bicolor S238N-H82]EDR07036.1 predicted protein [Laccaria bicolor S238N-H82]|eukprot:XP_001882409.1 predicted protein [Laccaria bicolor S238N-H82]